jgi:hypothetical protein
MFSLILAFLTIAFLSTLAVVAINYTPWWLERAQTAHVLASDGMTRLERAYDLASAAATPEEAPPVALTTGDGGAQSYFRPYVGFMPRPPAAMGWVYGHQSAAGSFEGMDYFCLAGADVALGEYQGVSRLAAALGPGQATLAQVCGATSATGVPASFPAAVALTYYVQYVSGIE